MARPVFHNCMAQDVHPGLAVGGPQPESLSFTTSDFIVRFPAWGGCSTEGTSAGKAQPGRTAFFQVFSYCCLVTFNTGHEIL